MSVSVPRSKLVFALPYLNRVRRTFLLCPKLVFAHWTCASHAFATALLMPSAVAGFTRLRNLPSAGQ